MIAAIFSQEKGPSNAIYQMTANKVEQNYC